MPSFLSPPRSIRYGDASTRGDPRTVYAVSYGLKRTIAYVYTADRLGGTGSIDTDSLLLVGSICGVLLSIGFLFKKYMRNSAEFAEKVRS